VEAKSEVGTVIEIEKVKPEDEKTKSEVESGVNSMAETGKSESEMRNESNHIKKSIKRPFY
jgi:hypothetical protein